MAAAQLELARFCERRAVPASPANRIELIFEELVSNAIRHGGARTLRVRARSEDASIVLEFEDDGLPFNPLELPQHQRPSRIEEATPGGLGVPLVLSFAATIRYESAAGPDVVNRILMTIPTAP
jgi:anti-sigma regulatory factor (Ser/Thr protein kinase)